MEVCNVQRATSQIAKTCAQRMLLVFCLAVGSSAPGWANEPPEHAVLATLPFQRPEEPNRVYIDLAPEGRTPFVMLLDTGATTSVITPRMARKMKISVRRLKTSPYRRKTVLGRDLQFWIDTSVTDTGSKTGWEYGLLGGDFLDDYVVEIDFPGRVVRFLDPKKYQVPETTEEAEAAVVPLKRAGTRISVPVELNGQEFSVLLDTGAPMGLVLSGKAFRKIGLDDSTLEDSGEVGTTLGPMKVKRYDAEDFRFGKFEFGRLPILVAPRGFYNIAGSTDSVLGYEAMEPFVMRIDYKRKRIWLKSEAGTTPSTAVEQSPTTETLPASSAGDS